MRLPWNRWETDFWLLNLPNSVTRLGTFYYSVASVFGEKVAQNWARYWANFEMELLFANWAAMFSIWKISCLKYLDTLLPNDAWSHASQWYLVTLLPNEAAFTSRTRCYFKNDQWEKQIDFQKIFSNAPAPASFCLLLSFQATQVVASDTRGPYFWFSHEHNLIPNEDIYLVSCWKERNKDKEAG